MSESDIPSAYVRDKRTPPPSREELRARIPGWGADLDPADRPSYPKLQYPADTGAHWDFPERQPQQWPRLFEHVRNGVLKPSAVVTHRIPLDEIAEGYHLMSNKLDGCIKPLVIPTGAH